MASRAIGKPENGASSSSSIVLLAAVVLGVSVMAAGAGYFVGSSLFNAEHAEKPKKVAEPATSDKEAVAAPVRHAIGPIIANLKSSERTYVRVEGVVFAMTPQPGDEVVAEQLADDILQHLRALNLQDLQGLSGMENLRADLNELVSLRFKNRAKEFLFKGFAVE